MPAPRRIIVPFNGHLIGQGFDSVTAERLGTAFDFDPPVEDPQGRSHPLLKLSLHGGDAHHCEKLSTGVKCLREAIA